MKIADGKNWSVGDHCYWIDVKTDGSRIIGDGQIVGLEASPGWGDRINISGIYTYTATGGPLLDEQGRVVGILGGALPASFINSVGSEARTDTSEAAYYATGGTSVAASLLPQSVGSTPASLQDLWAKGEKMPVVTDTRYVLFGMLTQGAKDGSKKNVPVLGERELKVNFRKSDTSANALIHFNAPDNLKSTSVIKLYDVDNHPAGVGKVEKLSLSRGESFERSWQLPLSTLPRYLSGRRFDRRFRRMASVFQACRLNRFGSPQAESPIPRALGTRVHPAHYRLGTSALTIAAVARSGRERLRRLVRKRL